MKMHFALSLFLLFAASCNGQNNSSQRSSAAAGLNIAIAGTAKIVKTQGSGPYDAVRCGLQDKRGNLWFGTTGEGVYRYDGRSFANFTTKDGLTSNTVASILEDKTGNIWFGSDAGVCRYAGNSITSVPMSMTGSNFLTGDNPSVRNTPSAMLQDKTGKIWIGTSKGVYCYNGSYFTHFLENDGVINKAGIHLNVVQSILEDKAGNIWFTTWFDGICRYDGKSIVNFKPNNEVWFADIMEDKEGNIWVGRRGKGVCRYDGKSFTNVLQNGIFDSCGVNTIRQDKAGNMWFGTEADDMTKRETMGGVWRYDGRNFKNFTMEDGLTNYSVFCIVEDKAGNLWFGTRNLGLCRYDGKSFTDFSADSNKK